MTRKLHKTAAQQYIKSGLLGRNTWWLASWLTSARGREEGRKEKQGDRETDVLRVPKTKRANCDTIFSSFFAFFKKRPFRV